MPAPRIANPMLSPCAIRSLPPHAGDWPTVPTAPTRDDHLTLREEADRIAALRVQHPQERAFRAAEGEHRHGRGHPDVDADVAGLDLVAELPRRRAALGED